MQPVDTSIILDVLQNYYTGVTRMLLKHSRRILLQERHLLAPFMCAMCVDSRKIKQILNCGWLSVDAVRGHIIKNVCLGNLLFSAIYTISLFISCGFTCFANFTREIAFEGDDDEGIAPRAWDKLLAGRILIYCL